MENPSQLFWRIFLKLDLFDVLFWLDWGYVFLDANPSGEMFSLFNVLHQRYQKSVGLITTGDVNFEDLAIIIAAKLLFLL